MKPSEAFTEMAADIERNPDKFGGAYVIVPPIMGGELVSGLIVRKTDPGASPASTAVNFWNVLQSEIKAVLEKLGEQERQSAAFGGRR